MKIFVTGGTGFLGGHFVQLAQKEGGEVVALVRPSSDCRALQAAHISLPVGDLADTPSLAQGMAGCEVVVHIASPKGGWKKPAIYQDLLIGGTQNILTAMKQSGVRRLVYLSTISVHGLDPLGGKPIREAHGFGQNLLPYDIYSHAKIEAEKNVQAAHRAGEIEATILRPGWVYGPRDNASYGRLADWMRRGLAMRIGNGRNRLPLVYVGNVAAFLWAAVVNAAPLLPECRTYLYAYDGLATQNDYLASLSRATGSRRGILPLPKTALLAATTLLENLAVASGYRWRAFLTRYYVHLMGSDWAFDQTAMSQGLGFVPPMGYEQGFALTEAWYRQDRAL